MEFVGHDNLGSVLGMSTYPVVQFKVGDSVFHFNGNMNLSLQKGQSIEVRYQRNNPSDARINSLGTVWGDTFAYGAGPTLCAICDDKKTSEKVAAAMQAGYDAANIKNVTRCTGISADGARVLQIN